MDIEFAERPGLKKYRTERQGFTDVRGRVGSGNDGLVVEIKSDDVDRLSERALQRRIAKYVEQIESYMYSPSLGFETMQGAVQFQRRPLTPGRAELVERAFNNNGISCVWLDQPIRRPKAGAAFGRWLVAQLGPVFGRAVAACRGFFHGSSTR